MRDLTEDEVLAAILLCGVELQGRVALTYDSGPYEVTAPTFVALRLASAIQRKFREVNAAGVQGIDGPRRGPVADGSQTPNDAAAIPRAKAGSNTDADGVATDQPAGWHVSFDGGLTWEYHADDPWGRLGERVAIVRPLIYGDGADWRTAGVSVPQPRVPPNA